LAAFFAPADALVAFFAVGADFAALAAFAGAFLVDAPGFCSDSFTTLRVMSTMLSANRVAVATFREVQEALGRTRADPARTAGARPC
jgi:hypothetical protein